MRQIARLPVKDREALFRNTAQKLGMTEAIIEKDFWVCWILYYLFNECPWKENLAFKGGTSLSKSFGLIKRFSEDIDLILDWRILGYTKDEPCAKRSITKQDIFNKEANLKAEEFLKNEFIPRLKNDLSKELNAEINCFTDADDGQTIRFVYPGTFSDAVILPEIRLEIGALAAWTPAAEKRITPYAAEQYPHLFSNAYIEVMTVVPERTFWEKATILHKEANRPKEKVFPSRYSRHYYDLYFMAKTDVKDKAFSDVDLLGKVAAFKDKFYHCTWAKYEEAVVKSIKLLPPDYNLRKLEDDYDHMQNMIFGDKPSFVEILRDIGILEKEIHNIKK